MKKLALALVFLVLVNVIGVLGVSADPLTIEGLKSGGDKTDFSTSNTLDIAYGAGGKDAEDGAYEFTELAYTNNGSTKYHSVQLSGAFWSNVSDDGDDTNDKKWSSSFKDTMAEFSFMLPDISKGLRFDTYTYKYDGTSNSSYSRAFFKITKDGLVDVDNSNKLYTYSFESGKWYNIAVRVAGASGSGAIKIYVNGKEVVSRNPYNTSAAYNVGGIRYIAIYTQTDGAKYYLDNVVSDCVSVDTARNEVSEIASVKGKDFALNASTKEVGVPVGTKVSDLIAGITTTDSEANTDVIRVYTDAAMTTEAGANDEAIGKTVVIAATNGYDHERAYSYYNVVKGEKDLDVFKGEMNYTSNDIILRGGKANENAISSVEGNYGKLESDKVYKYVHANYDNNGTATHDAVWIKGGANKGALEFSFCLEDFENNCVKVWGVLNKGTLAQQQSYTIYFTSEGIVHSSGDVRAKYNFESGKWYTVTFDFPSDGTTEGGLYINGQKVHKYSDAAGFNLAYMLLSVAKADTKGSAVGEVLYLDNIKRADTPDALRDMAATVNVTNGAAKNGKLSMLSDSKDNISTNADSVRMYDASGALTESFADAKTVVFAAENGLDYERTLTYYEKDIKDLIVDYNLDTDNKGTEETTDDVTTLDAKVYSNSGATLIVAEYDKDEGVKQLMDVKTLPANLDGGIYKAELDTLTINNGNTYYIYVWNSLTGLKPLEKIALVR